MNIIDKYLNESMSRHCEFYKAKDKKWYMDLAEREYAGYEDATTYGPFDTLDIAHDYLDNFSNPGSYGEDASGKNPVPKKSPNGKQVQKPQSRSDRLFGGYGRF